MDVFTKLKREGIRVNNNHQIHKKERVAYLIVLFKLFFRFTYVRVVKNLG